jgi:eukaryotic-like serine/threonine-protein kinase
LGDPAGAAADLRRATALIDALPPRSSENWFLSACAHAALAGLGDQPGSGVSAAQAASEVDTAIASLHRAIDTGYRSPGALPTEDALHPLRGRQDFKLLMMDLAFPEQVFDRSE